MNPKVQGVLNEIEAARANVYAAANSFSQAQLDFKPSPDSWSIGEVLSHLQVVEKGLPRLYSMLMAKAAEAGLTPETEGSWVKSLDEFQLEVVTTKMPAPERVLPQFGIPKNELIVSLQQSRQALIDAVSNAGDFDYSGVKFPHPFFGEINFYQWILFVGKHETRHLSQIEKIKNEPGFPK